MNEVVETGKYISLLSRLILKYNSNELTKIGLSPIEYSYIMILSDEKVKTQEELTKAAMVDKAQTTRAVKSLLEKGFINKVQCPDDKRAYHISITNKGLEIVPKVKKEIIAFETMLNQGLTKQEQRNMKKYLIQMIRNLR